jgi:hypothetical protein
MTLPPARHVVVVDTRWRHLADVEHALFGIGEEVGLGAAWVCTHMLTAPEPHYAVSVCSDGPLDEPALAELADRLGDRPLAPCAPDAPDALAVSHHQLTTGDGPRAVRFPGQDEIRGDVTVAELLARTAIERVNVLGGAAATPGDVVETRDFLRPLFRGGQLVLPVLPAGANRLAPFEVPDPTPCCGERRPVPVRAR